MLASEQEVEPPAIGSPIPGAVHFLRQLWERYWVIIHTCRVNEGMHEKWNPENLSPEARAVQIEEWLDAGGFSYDEIWLGCGKPYADWYIDNRAMAVDEELPHLFDTTLRRLRFYETSAVT